MTSVTRQKSEAITQHVLDCNIWRLSADETAKYLGTHGYEVDVRTVKRYRARIKASAGHWIAALAKSKRNDYIFEYKQRIDEIRTCQRELWTISHKKDITAQDKIRIEALSKLMECTLKLTDLYDRLPVVNAIRDYDSTAIAHQEHEEKRV